MDFYRNTKILVHKWRAEEDAILVGRNTVENDNPELTVREYKGNNPIRIVIDPDLKLNYNNIRYLTNHQKQSF